MNKEDQDDIRSHMRGAKKNPAAGSIFSMWEEQKQLEEEDKRLERELSATKKKARELQRTLYRNKVGEGADKLFKVAEKAREKANFAHRYAVKVVNKRPKTTALATLLIIVVSAVGLNVANKDQKDILGESTSVGTTTTPELVRETPDFKLLFPAEKSESQYEVVRISPPEAAASYTFLDRITDDGIVFRVTQQEIPENFSIDQVATDFQATNVIQVDDTKVFHGYSERGNTQSLIFVKDDKLISIRSPQKLDDSQWATYVASLK